MNANADKNVLVTGMSGLIGSALRPHLEGVHRLRALNRRPIDGVETVQADLSDAEAIRPAFEDIHTVVHLAAKAGERFTWDELLQTNIAGTRNVLHAAVAAGCKRVVFASSGATVSGYEQVEPYKAIVEARYDDAPASWPLLTASHVHPTGIYGSTKVWGEALGRHVADTTELSVIALRIGFVNRDDKPQRPRDFAIWCSQRDICDLLVKAVEAPADLKFGIFFGTSRNKWGYRDLKEAIATLGFDPRDEAEAYR